MSAFDPEKIKQALLRLDLAVYAPLREPLTSYCRHYGLDLENTVPRLRHYCGFFEAADYRLAAHVFLPEEARGTVFILHGYLDHAGLYRHMIQHCVERGFAVFIYDLPGHGLSSGARVDIPDFLHYQRVLQEALAVYKQQLPGPFYALGQSTGGAILMDHVLSQRARGRQPAFRKVLLLAPLVRPVQWAQIRFSYWLIHRFRQRVPRVFRSNSGDQGFLDFVQHNDPLQERWVPMSWIGALKQWMRYMRTLPASDFPVILVQGQRDDTVDWRFNSVFAKTHFRIEHCLELPEAGHQLVNERADIRAPVHEALDWLLTETSLRP